MTTEEFLHTECSNELNGELQENIVHTSVNNHVFAMKESHMRVCHTCKKTRIVEKFAGMKYNLGSYWYAEQNLRVLFECEDLY